jgi:Flp pilus assembly protein CpaB
MNQWAFVLAAYAVTAVATAVLVAWAFWTMRSAEAEVEALKRRQ